MTATHDTKAQVSCGHAPNFTGFWGTLADDTGQRKVLKAAISLAFIDDNGQKRNKKWLPVFDTIRTKHYAEVLLISDYMPPHLKQLAV